VNKYKVAKHFELTISDESFDFALHRQQIAAEAALDGIYVIRSGAAKRMMSSGDAVRNYKALSSGERAFRSLKTVDLKVRPIHHRLENCMLAYYVEWHMRDAWKELLFADEDQAAKATSDPVAPAQRSAAAEKKASSKRLEDGTPAHSFRTLLEELSTIVRNTCRVPGSAPTFPILTVPNDLQIRTRELIDKITL
jgi:hypothetical protein